MLPQTLLAKVCAALAALFIVVTIGFVGGYAFEHRALVAYQLQVQLAAQQAKDKADEVAAQNKQVQEKIDADNQKALAGYAGYVAQLLREHAPGGVPPVPAAPGARVPDGHADGPGAGPADRDLSCPDRSADDHLTLDALIQLKSWRDYARGTGQAGGK